MEDIMTFAEKLKKWAEANGILPGPGTKPSEIAKPSTSLPPAQRMATPAPKPAPANPRPAPVSPPPVKTAEQKPQPAIQLIPQPMPQSATRYTTTVVGVTYEGRQDVLARLHRGQRLILRREPNNPYDRNAIGVRTEDGAHAGHINRHLAARFAPKLDQCGGEAPAEVIAVTGGYTGDYNYGLEIAFWI
jgi:hypothetical protein